MTGHRAFFAALLVVLAWALPGCATYTITEIPKGELHVQISADQKAKMLRVLRRHTTMDLYVAPNIPPDKLANARRTCVTPADEEVLALVNSTVFGSAENALLVGTSGVFFRNDYSGSSPGRFFLPYAEFQDAVFRKNGAFEVSIDGPSFDIAGCSMSKDELIILLGAIQEVIRLETKG